MDIITYGLLNGKVKSKADIDSPHFTGEPTAETPEYPDSSERLATTEFVQVATDTKNFYATETSGGSQDAYAKRYSFYQGEEGSAQTPVEREKVIDLYIPKDMVISEGTMTNIVFENNRLWDGQTDVTEIIKGSDTPSEADAGKYIRLTISNSTSDRIYIKVSDLVDVYTGGTTNETSVSIDANKEITVNLNDDGIAKIKLSPTVQASLDLADSAIQDGDIGDVNDEDIEALFGN